MFILIPGLLVSYIPAALLYLYLRGLHGKDPGYRADCRRLLKDGILCSFAVVLLAFVLNILWNMSGLGKGHPLLNEFVKAFVFAAFAEEFVKCMTAGRMIRRNADKVSRLDIIAYCGIVSIGFHLLESVVYFFGTNLIQILVRGIIELHAAFGMTVGMGLATGLAKKKKIYTCAGFILAVFLHGMYDFSLSEEFLALNDNLVFVPFIVILILLVIMVRILLMIHKQKNNEAYTKPLKEIM